MMTPAPTKPRLEPLAALLDDFLAETTERWEARRDHQPLGPVTGFPALDRALGGFLAPGLHVLHGGP